MAIKFTIINFAKLQKTSFGKLSVFLSYEQVVKSDFVIDDIGMTIFQDAVCRDHRQTGAETCPCGITEYCHPLAKFSFIFTANHIRFLRELHFAEVDVPVATLYHKINLSPGC